MKNTTVIKKKTVGIDDAALELDLSLPYEQDELVSVTGALLTLDEIEEFSEPTLGHHRVVIEDWINQPERWEHPNRDKWAPEEERHYDAHVELHLRDTDSNLLYRKRVYAKGLESFLKNLNRQAKGKLAGQKASAKIDYFKTHELDIWAVWSDEFSLPIILFFDLDEVKARQLR